jgi:FAD/FMN-containing dehydrogenase
MNTPTILDLPADKLRSALRGPVFAPTDTGYEHARQVWNGSIDRSPALIALPTGVADVIAAVRFADEHNLPIAVRGGGHSFAGFGTCDHGLLIDLGLMKGVRVDPRARRVIAQGGVTWAELDHETASFGLATTGGLVSSTGIAGLTLGGGIGWLMRKHGLACDNLVSADVVTADGQLLHASEDDNPELFWALRGGGGNFGVVTSFEYRLHPVATVLGGLLLYPADYATDILARYAAAAGAEPDELCTLVEFATAPDADYVAAEHRGRPVVALGLCYCGPVADGEAAIAQWRHAAPVVADLVEAMPYPALQALFDEDYPAGLWSYMKAHYLDDLSRDVITSIAAAAAARPTPQCFIDVHHLEGAPARVDPDTTAFDHRQARYAVLLGGISDDNTRIDVCRSWAQEHWSALAPHATGNAYMNFIADTDTASVRAAWGAAKYDRLVTVKDRYDPTNRFCFNHNISPTNASA